MPCLISLRVARPQPAREASSTGGAGTGRHRRRPRRRARAVCRLLARRPAPDVVRQGRRIRPPLPRPVSRCTRRRRAVSSRLAAQPEGALALLLLLDQFPRNAFRGTPRMYATDALARESPLRPSLPAMTGGRAELQRSSTCPSATPRASPTRTDRSARRALGEPNLSHANRIATSSAVSGGSLTATRFSGAR